MNEMLMRQMGFNEEMDYIKERKCPLCRKEIRQGEFRDTLSRKEYRISGMYQECQDKTFG